MASPTKKMQYVRLGNSGLKVSKIILGCMTYGSPEWQKWVLSEEEGIKHIKFAYDQGIQSFDTANVYSNGLSEIILGKAIKQLKLPRDEIVVMTKLYEAERWNTGNRQKVCGSISYFQTPAEHPLLHRVEEIAKKKGVGMAQISVAWSLSKDGVSAPIVGTTSLKNLEEMIDAIHIKLTEEEVKYLEEPYCPVPIAGHN
ncbi:Aldo/keto reductase [Pleurotus eryngii]|uniref:Aldo/keto reductase n=1 Tax=Pleurotus eryngii TaxID=5323 RepID=A0A9P6ABK6_PLEER|nr:Aldo/keto reductase [Pleurotus eryngii]